MEIDSSSSSPSPPSALQSQPQSQSQSQPNQITPSDRIAELNSIDLSISSLLHSASTATAVLANQQSNTSLSAAQAKFSSAAQFYFSTLSSIDVRLRRQVYALEEAGLIQSGDEKDTRRGRTLNNEDGALRRGGGGPLDPSWLNAQVSESTEVAMKRELLERAKNVVQKADRKDSSGVDVNMDGNG